MTWVAALWALAITFGLLAAYVGYGFSSGRYHGETKETKSAIRWFGMMFAILAIWFTCWATALSGG